MKRENPFIAPNIVTLEKLMSMPKTVPLHIHHYTHKNNIQLEHSHNFIEIGYVKSGEILHTVNNKNYHLKEGDYFIIDIGTSHSYISLNEKKPMILINCLFFPVTLDKSLQSIKSFNDMLLFHPFNIPNNTLSVDPTNVVFHDDTGEIDRLLNELTEEAKYETFLSNQMINSLLTTLIIKTLRKNYSVDTTSSKTITNSILRYSAEHYAEDYVLTELSKTMNYSLAYLSTVFKNDTGITFREHIKRLRIREACRLLVSSHYKVQDICNLIGYKSENQFHRAFKEITGTTPKKYRKENTLA